ncbi:hypothetical protein JOF56_003469 [Kibdelosporangium banguiense]|uniref:Secreted protein n=2 Tax=Kibdelosporangium banguiense TaxID=1365924 RepID=A0ABS4TF98_9PSEU|nr:hypothetical protein [Kibdelosporangium banguiense]
MEKGGGMRGLLLLDVDGPLNPYAAKATRRPPGYSTYRLTPQGRWLTGKDARRRKGMRVWLNPDHGEQLWALAEETGLTLAWATTWLHQANAYVAPVLALPDLPVVEFPESDLQPVAGGHHWRRDGSWKWSGVAEFAGGRPLAWLDDEHDDPMYAEARQAFEQSRAGKATLLVHVDPSTGMRPDHMDMVRAWALG